MLSENRFEKCKKKKRVCFILKNIRHDGHLIENKSYVGKEVASHMRRCSCPLCKRGLPKSRKIAQQQLKFDLDPGWIVNYC